MSLRNLVAACLIASVSLLCLVINFCAFLYLFIVFFFFSSVFCSVMALRLSCNGELSEAPCMSQAADPTNEPSKMCNQIFNTITTNIADCDTLDIYDNKSIPSQDSDSLILMHLNIRSLHKTLMTCMNLSACFPSNQI